MGALRFFKLHESTIRSKLWISKKQQKTKPKLTLILVFPAHLRRKKPTRKKRNRCMCRLFMINPVLFCTMRMANLTVQHHNIISCCAPQIDRPISAAHYSEMLSRNTTQVKNNCVLTITNSNRKPTRCNSSNKLMPSMVDDG